MKISLVSIMVTVFLSLGCTAETVRESISEQEEQVVPVPPGIGSEKKEVAPAPPHKCEFPTTWVIPSDGGVIIVETFVRCDFPVPYRYTGDPGPH